MWRLFQLAIMLLVGLIAVHFDWQHAGRYDHGIAPAAIMVGSAYLATVMLSRIIDAVRWVRSRQMF